jgi:hypothetical protein
VTTLPKRGRPRRVQRPSGATGPPPTSGPNAQGSSNGAEDIRSTSEEQREEIAALIRFAREERRWTVKELSRQTGLSPAYLYLIESFGSAEGKSRLAKSKRSPSGAHDSKSRPERPSETVNVSREALEALARALDLDVFRLMALVGVETKPGAVLLKESRDRITRMVQTLARLDIAYSGLLHQQPVEIATPQRWSTQLRVARGDHILLFVGTSKERELALPLLNGFLAEHSDGETEGVVVFPRSDTHLSDVQKWPRSYVVHDPSLGELLERARSTSPDELHTLPRILYYSPDVIASEDLRRTTKLSRHEIIRIFHPASRYFKVTQQRFARWLFEDSSASLGFLGSLLSPVEAANVRREFLGYEAFWDEDMGHWAYPGKAPILLCNYVGADLSQISDPYLPLPEIIFKLLGAHDVVWALPPGSADYLPTNALPLTGGYAVRWLLEEYVLPHMRSHSEWWRDLDAVATKFNVWGSVSRPEPRA